MKTHKVYKDRCTYHYIPNGIEAISYDSRYQVRTNSGLILNIKLIIQFN